MRDKGRVGVNPSLAAGSGWLVDQLVGWLDGQVVRQLGK